MSDLSDFFSQLIAGQLFNGGGMPMPQEQGIDPYQVISGNAQIPPQMLAQALHLNLLNGTTPFSGQRGYTEGYGGGQGQNYTEASGSDGPANVIPVPPPQPIMTPGNLPEPPNIPGPPTAAERLAWQKTVGPGTSYLPLEDWVAQHRAGAGAGAGRQPVGPDPNAYYQEDTGGPMSLADIGGPGTTPPPIDLRGTPTAPESVVLPPAGATAGAPAVPTGDSLPAVMPQVPGSFNIPGAGRGGGFNSNALMQLLAADMLKSRQTDIYDKMLEFGLATMAAAGKPMATTLGAVGEGGLAALKGGREREAASLKNLVSGAQIANVMSESALRGSQVDAKTLDSLLARGDLAAGGMPGAMPTGAAPTGGSGGSSEPSPAIPFGPGNPGSLAMAHSSEQQEAVAKTIATTSGLQHWGGVDPNTGKPWNPKLRAAFEVAGLPVSGPVSAEQWEKAKPLVLRYESDGGKNIPNYRFDATHTAGGPFQITNSTWKEFATPGQVTAGSGGSSESAPLPDDAGGSGGSDSATPPPSAGGDPTKSRVGAISAQAGSPPMATPTGAVNPAYALWRAQIAANAGNTSGATYWYNIAKAPDGHTWTKNGTLVPIAGDTRTDPAAITRTKAAEAAGTLPSQIELAERKSGLDTEREKTITRLRGDIEVDNKLTEIDRQHEKNILRDNNVQKAMQDRELVLKREDPIKLDPNQTGRYVAGSQQAKSIAAIAAANGGKYPPGVIDISPNGDVTLQGSSGALLVNKVMEELGKDFNERRVQARAARTELGYLKDARRMVDEGIFSGPAATRQVAIADWLSKAGYTRYEDAAATTRAFMMQRGQAALNILASGAYGTGQSITQQDKEAAEKMANGDINIPEKSIIKLMALTEQMAKEKISVFDSDAPNFNRLIQQTIPGFDLRIGLPEDRPAASSGTVTTPGGPLRFRTQ